jgi:eukaryotic-like serine/threonine-protein kinase
MPTLLVETAERSTLLKGSDGECSPTDDGRDADRSERLAATRRVEVPIATAEAMKDLRTNDPKTADRIDAALAEMPTIGQVFVGFKLMHELGRGAFGRVFLAQQTNLADRRVALKIAVDLNGESQRLAQLQHTNIVPIYSEHRAGGLNGFCMPYCGSTTLADVCKNLSSSNSLPTSGKQLVSTLFNRQSTVRQSQESYLAASQSRLSGKSDPNTPSLSLSTPSLATVPENLSKIEQMSYVGVVLWMASRLADGLAHAHERGIIHRDLKPANVLLCDDGQPMLLDFNLAEDVKLRSSLAVAQVGGTLPYMAPEQLIAFRDGAGEVDGRGDIYALGLIVYHLLTGRHAFPIRKGQSRTILPQMIEDRQGPPPGLREFNCTVSPAVEAIVRRCLEADPAKRYLSARDLVEDIERHRADLPLKHTKEPSHAERAAKWARRNPRLVSPTTLSFLIAAFMLTVVSVCVYQSLERRDRERKAAGDVRREQALALYQDFRTEYPDIQDSLASDNPTRMAEGLEKGEKVLREYGVFDQPNWTEQSTVQELAPPDRAALKSDIGFIAYLLAQATQIAPQGVESGRVLQLNELAERNLDENTKPVLKQQQAALGVQTPLTEADRQAMRQKLENAAGLNVQARFLLACDHAVHGRYPEALTILDGVIVVDPSDFGAWLMKARCHNALNQDVEAIAAYGTAIALRPNHVNSYMARAVLYYTHNRQLDQAIQDLNQVLKLQPEMIDAHINRGLVYYSLRQFKKALVDLDWVLERNQAPARVWFIRSSVKRAMGDEAGADDDRRRAMETEPADPISYVSRGVAMLATDPEAALADFNRAEEMCPRFVHALQNRAYVLAAKLNKPQEAILALERLLGYYPDNVPAHSYRALLLARTGKIDEAIAEAHNLMKKNGTAEFQYRAACVYAIATNKKPEMKGECLRLLAMALGNGYGHDLVNTDHDLDAIRDRPEFKQLTALTGFMRYIQSSAPGVK